MNKKVFPMTAIMAMLYALPVGFAADEAAKEVPSWVYETVAGLIELDATLAGSVHKNPKMTRDEMAQLVAKIIAKTETAGIEDGESYHTTLNQVGDITRRLAKAEEMERRAAKDIIGYKAELTRAEKNLNVCAAKLASAELTEIGLASLGKLKVQYEEALQNLGYATKRLVRAQQAQNERQAYIRILQEQNLEAFTRLRGEARQDAVINEIDSGQEAQMIRLKMEFQKELENMGYGAVAAAEVPLHVAGEEKFKWSGEARYNYVFNDGFGRMSQNDSRLRTRIYLEAVLNPDWNAYSMLESDKSFFWDNRDGSLKWDRFYIQGKTGATQVAAGSFGYMMAEGNVYDSTVEGAVFQFGDPIKYNVGWGRTNDSGVGYMASASYKTQDYNVEGGLYQFEDSALNNGTHMIGYFGGNYQLGRYRLGAMYLVSNSLDRAKERDGYVLTMGYGELKTWRPGSYSLFAKYYDQARGTYISHTMVGSAGYMEGFKGYGLGGYYTIAENLVYGMEYYDIEDKSTGAGGRTLWNQVTYYF